VGLRDKLVRIARRAEDRRATVEIEDAFEANMKKLSAQANGETPPPSHPISSNPRFAGTFLDGEMTIVDEDGEILEGGIGDLSE